MGLCFLRPEPQQLYPQLCQQHWRTEEPMALTFLTCDVMWSFSSPLVLGFRGRTLFFSRVSLPSTYGSKTLSCVTTILRHSGAPEQLFNRAFGLETSELL